MTETNSPVLLRTGQIPSARVLRISTSASESRPSRRSSPSFSSHLKAEKRRLASVNRLALIIEHLHIRQLMASRQVLVVIAAVDACKIAITRSMRNGVPVLLTKMCSGLNSGM